MKGELQERHLSGVGRARGKQSAQLPTPRQPPDAACFLIPRYSNLDLQTQEAYEMAVRGLIRPMNKSPMLITGIRCLHFAPPEFLLGKSPREVGAGRWGSWAWGVTAECPCRGQHIPALSSAGQGSGTNFLPALGWTGLITQYSEQMLS